MPPRYAYWTILIGTEPTAFRAREREELLPTLNQLKRKSPDVVLKWFARGRLWESPEAERAAQGAPKAPHDTRGGDWRPGGAHKDPRDRFKKRNRDKTAAARVSSDEEPSSSGPNERPPRKPWSDRPAGGAPRGDRPWSNKPAGHPPRGDRPWSNKPAGGAPRGDRPWSNKPAGGAPRGDRPWRDKPASHPPRGDRPWSSKPPSGAPRGDRLWSNKPASATPRGDRPWINKPPGRPRTGGGSNPTATGGGKQWGAKPHGQSGPWRDKLAGGTSGRHTRDAKPQGASGPGTTKDQGPLTNQGRRTEAQGPGKRTEHDD